MFELATYGVSCLTFGLVHRAPYYPSLWASASIWLCALLAVAAFSAAGGRSRRRLLGILLVALAPYAMIGIGRGVFAHGERTAHLASSARFHYLGPAALCVALGLVLAEVARRDARLARFGRRALPVWWVAVLAIHLLRGPMPRSFEYSRQETMQTLASIRASVAAARPGEAVYIDNRGFNSIGMLLYGARQRFPGWAGVFAIYHPEQVIDGRRVRFLESDRRVIEQANRGRRTAGLLVSYEEAGRTPPPTPARARAAPGATRGGMRRR
jgi:hypothetical protein